MNTGIRRFILRLAVGLVAFLVGVSAVWALGGFNPFQSFSGGRQQYRQKRCGHYRSELVPMTPPESQASSATLEPTYLVGPHGCRMKKDFSHVPPPPPAPAVVR